MMMISSESNSERAGLLSRWSRFLAGLILLSAFAGFFMSGYTPPGVFGEVLRHNQTCDIDASPLLYSEVEHMAQLEEGVRLMREAARKTVTPGPILQP